MASSQVSMSIAPGVHRKLRERQDALCMLLGRQVTLSEVLERLLEQADPVTVAP